MIGKDTGVILEYNNFFYKETFLSLFSDSKASF